MKGKKVLAALLALSMTAGLGLAGCGNKNSASKGNEKNNDKKAEEKKDESKDKESKEGEKIDKDQYINAFIGGEPKSLDPVRSTDAYSNNVHTHILDGLTRIQQENGKDKIVPGIAENWDIEDEGKTYIFHLRDAQWSDGQAVTAGDFVYGLTRTLDPKSGGQYAWIIKDIVKGGSDFNAGNADASSLGITAIDDKTLKIELESPVAYFLDLTYFRVLLPQRKDMVEKYGESFGSEGEHMMSNGAFLLKEWVHDNKFVFEKNPNYWDADNVKLEKFTFNIVKDENARMNMILNGGVDSGAVGKPEWMKKFDDLGQFNKTSVALPTASYEYYNQKNKYFKNAKIRKAFIIATDREDINKSLYQNKYTPATGWCPPAVQIGGEDYRKKADFEPVTQLIKENPDPKALLIEGLKEEGLDPDPSKMEVTMLSGSTNARAKEMGEYEQQELQTKLGIKVKIDYYDWAIFQKKTDAYEYEFASQLWNGDYNDPMTFFEMFTDYSKMTPHAWKNEEYEKLIKQTTQTSDNEERFKMFKRAEEIVIYEDAVISPKIFFTSNTYRRKYVKNVYAPLFGSTDFTRAYTEGRK